MRIVGPLVETLGDLGATVRGLARTREVAAVLARHGLGALVKDLPGVTAVTGDTPTPEHLARALAELGPTWVKLGQVLSTRPDLLGPEWITALQRLQDDAKALPASAVEGVLAAELGEGWRGRFASFEEAPLGTASIAQVHGAVLQDGTRVVVKVQRPGIAAQVEADLLVLRFLARRATEEWPAFAAADPEGVLREFERTLRAELDFRREAEHLARFGRLFAGRPELVFPAPIDGLVTPRALAMTRLEGTPIRKARAAGHDMAVVGRRYLDAVFEMILGHGFFHGDLHPGNVFVLEGDRLGLLDCGMVGTLTDKMRAELVTMIFALQRGDHRTIARVLYDIALKDGRLDFRALERATIEVVEEHFPSGAQLRDIEMGAFSMELVQRSATLGARVPTSYLMVLKALITAEGLAKSLLDEVDPVEVASPWFARVVGERMTQERLQMEGLYTLLTLGSLLDRLPLAAAQLLDDLDAQRVSVGARVSVDAEAERRADRRTGRLVTAGLAAAALGTGGIVFTTAYEGFGVAWMALGVVLGLLAALGWVR